MAIGCSRWFHWQQDEKKICLNIPKPAALDCEFDRPLGAHYVEFQIVLQLFYFGARKKEIAAGPMSETAKRPWLRYLVGAIAVTVLVGLIWLDTRSKWIADRDRARTWIWSHAGSLNDEASVPPSPRPAPWSLRICGETGVASITIDELKMRQKLPSSEDRDPQLAARRAQRLFPEADVRIRNVLGIETPVLEPPPARD